MLKIIEKPQKTPAQDVDYTTPTTVQKLGIEMLIALNLTTKDVITAPEVNVDSKILVTKIKPHFFFNPAILDSKQSTTDSKDSIIHISYQNYLGKDKKIEINDADGAIRTAIEYLHNGTVVKKVAKKKAKKKAK